MKTLMLSMFLVLSSLVTTAFAVEMNIHNAHLSESEALTFKKTDSSFILSWVEGPKRGGSKFIVKTWKKDVGTMNGPFQDFSKTFFVMLWMPSMGHGSVPVKIKKIADGEYEISDVQFIMPGKWEIKFQLKDGNQVFDETVVSLTI